MQATRVTRAGAANTSVRFTPKASSAHFMCGLAAVLCLLVGSASGQLYTGTIAGTVTDSSGALIAGVQIKATDAEKGFSFTATSDSGGRYVIRQLPPAKYTVSAKAAGFKTERKEGVTIEISQNAAVDFSLKVGAATEVVDVKAGTVEDRKHGTGTLRRGKASR